MFHRRLDRIRSCGVIVLHSLQNLHNLLALNHKYPAVPEPTHDLLLASLFDSTPSSNTTVITPIFNPAKTMFLKLHQIQSDATLFKADIDKFITYSLSHAPYDMQGHDQATRKRAYARKAPLLAKAEITLAAVEEYNEDNRLFALDRKN